jgi:hypothetical protein
MEETQNSSSPDALDARQAVESAICHIAHGWNLPRECERELLEAVLPRVPPVPIDVDPQGEIVWKLTLDSKDADNKI